MASPSPCYTEKAQQALAATMVIIITIWSGKYIRHFFKKAIKGNVGKEYRGSLTDACVFVWEPLAYV